VGASKSIISLQEKSELLISKNIQSSSKVEHHHYPSLFSG